MEEDRRLFFVACTRAKKSLYLSYPAGSGTKPLLASQFLEEIEGTYTSEESIEPRDISHKDVILGDVHQSLYRYETDEFQYIEEFLKHYRLSPSDLNTFLEDPIEFLHRTVFRYPFQDNVYTIF
ncbi:MAG: hypothetical protein H6767_01425 [Candidatus Peribacteria bacterium]|nr:MAG: hypothetical protein H6767_01425 [Candidatus Peribacteria bacterium]